MTLHWTDAAGYTPREIVACARCRTKSYADQGRLNDRGLCGTCRMCQRCGQRENVGAATVCDRCRCQDCKSMNVVVTVPDGSGYLCSRCASRRFPGQHCRECGMRKPSVMLRGQKVTTLCRECAFIEGSTHHCWYCGSNKAYRPDVLHRAICPECMRRPACYNTPKKPNTRGCDPTHQCRDHRAEQATMDAAILAQQRPRRILFVPDGEEPLLIVERADNPHQHRRSRTTDMCVRTCQACLWELERRRTEAAQQRVRERLREQTIFIARGEVIFHKAGISEFKRNKSHRFIGAEIEVCGLMHLPGIQDVRRTVQGLAGSIVHDGSLPATGFEICTAATQGDLYPKHIEEIAAALQRGGAFVDESAGLHVHIDCRDFTYDDMRKLLVLYSRIEPALIAMQPWARVFAGHPQTGRIYCAPCGYKYAKGIIHLSQPKGEYKSERKTRLLENVYGPLQQISVGRRDPETGGRKQVGLRIPRTDHYNGARYNALNVHSWFYRGTIECRLHEGTLDANEITSWGMLWASIVDLAYKTSLANIVSSFSELPEPKVGRNQQGIRVLSFPLTVRQKALANLVRISPNAEVSAYITDRVKRYAADHRSHD